MTITPPAPSFASIEIAAADAGHRLGDWRPLDLLGAFDRWEAACVAPACGLAVRASFGSRLPKGMRFEACPLPRA